MRVLAIVLFLLPATASADVTGVWEISSLGVDRRVEIWQDGDELVAYRIMFPEFEGEKYKLEHLFRGHLSGKNIDGELLVKEEGMRSFDPLRSFRGRLEADGTVVLDGLPMKKTSAKLKSKTPPKTGARKRRVRRGPKMGILLPLWAREVA